MMVPTLTPLLVSPSTLSFAALRGFFSWLFSFLPSSLRDVEKANVHAVFVENSQVDFVKKEK